MANVSFNRKRAKLKQVLGIRARLALLAVILVTPLMFERIRSLEDTRTRQIAQAATEFTTVARHSADAQREVISSVETILKSEAYHPRLRRRHQQELRRAAREPAVEPSLDPHAV